MSVITIQCRLVAPEQDLRELWKLMADKNTPFANEMLERLAKHDDFNIWLKNSRIPANVIKELSAELKNQEQFKGQPGRFYTSATALVTYIYKSWLALHKRFQRQVAGKEKWLGMLKSDVELEQASNSSLETIRAKATEILNEIAVISTNDTKGQSKEDKSKKTPKKQASNYKRRALFEKYNTSEDILTRCAIIFLLKNKCQVTLLEEDPEEYTQRRRQKEIEIKRLKDKLKGHIPKGRDLTGEEWLEILEKAVSQVPKDENEAKLWQDCLLRKSKSTPFPVAYETNEDMKWEINHKGRIFVSFNGLGKLKFEIYCDKRHLPYFRRFFEDQEIKRKSKNQYSSSLFTLRSGRIFWSEKAGKGEPWNLHRLHLFCSIDTRMWTLEGTQQVTGEKIVDVQNKLARAKEKEKQEGGLSSNQQAYVTRQESILARIKTPFPRPSQPLYQGKSHILVGVRLGLDKPVTIAVFDAVENKVLEYRTTKQLLRKNYNLLNRQQHQKQHLSHKRYQAQKKFAPNNFGESELGQYVDRLLSKEIVRVATIYSAGIIVIPKLTGIREIIESQIQVKAERKIPGYIEGQQEYGKAYRKQVHNWSYNRLITNIEIQAAKTGIFIETVEQSVRGNALEEALNLAMFAYQSRIAT